MQKDYSQRSPRTAWGWPALSAATNYTLCDFFPVIRAKVKEVKTKCHDVTAVVEVKEILKSSLVNIPKDTVNLHANSGCLCPPLSTNEEYIIMGYEDEERSRLLFLHYPWSIFFVVCSPARKAELQSHQLRRTWCDSLYSSLMVFRGDKALCRHGDLSLACVGLYSLCMFVDGVTGCLCCVGYSWWKAP